MGTYRQGFVNLGKQVYREEQVLSRTLGQIGSRTRRSVGGFAVTSGRVMLLEDVLRDSLALPG